MVLQEHYNIAARFAAKSLETDRYPNVENKSENGDSEVQELFRILPKITDQQPQVAGQPGQIVVQSRI